MDMSGEIEVFIKNFVRDIEENNVAIFAGAGMSKASGFVDWKELLRDIAKEIGLEIDQEADLISVAQFYVNRKSKDGLAKKILHEFSEQAELSDTHKIIARLPIGTYWTTNYDTLIEDSLKAAFKVADVKHSVKQMSTTRPKRDAVVYKMHGDVTVPHDAILHKGQYEKYYKTHEAFVTALQGDLVSKTFLFIGFSFTDPNLDYVLSRLHVDPPRDHYAFMRREDVSSEADHEVAKIRVRRQELRVEDLKRFGIQAVMVDDYRDIPLILLEIEKRFRKRTVFISGSAEIFGDWTPNDALGFIHNLSGALIRKNCRIINGFGWGIGSAVINGALEAVYASPERYSESQLIIKPFPQFSSGGKQIQELWEDYRQRMISQAGIAIFVFGNKKNDKDKIISAKGVEREFDIAIQRSLVPVPVGATGFMAKHLAETVLADAGRFYGGNDWIIPHIAELHDPHKTPDELIGIIESIVARLNK